MNRKRVKSWSLIFSDVALSFCSFRTDLTNLGDNLAVVEQQVVVRQQRNFQGFLRVGDFISSFTSLPACPLTACLVLNNELGGAGKNHYIEKSTKNLKQIC